ncbi:MAG: GumC family protein [Bryobacteraceae bacterium]
MPVTEDIRPGEAELTFGALYSLLSRKRRVLLLVILISAAASTILAFLIPVKYTAQAVILTPQRTHSSISSMLQLGAGGAGGGLSALSLLYGFGRNPSDLYIGILKSRTIADALIDKFHLKQVYGVSTYYRARKDLARNTTIDAGKDTLIHIAVEDSDPRRSADLANAYVAELSKENSDVALSEAKQRRIFFQKQLAKEKDALGDAEIALRNTQQVTGLLQPGGQAEALLRATSRLHAEILGVQAELAGMSTYATSANPRYAMLKSELSALQTELSKLQTGPHAKGTPEIPFGKLPEASLKYLRRYRNVKYHETLYEILAKEYEAARLDEAKAAPRVEVLDEAVTPERKSWPPRTIIVILSITLSVLIAVLYFFTKENTWRHNR